MKIITGTSNIPLAKEVAEYINIPLANAAIKRFADDEVFVEIKENIRGEDVFIICSTSHPANDNLVELLVTIDALKRASAKRITAVMPYYGYARQDRKAGPRTPISAKLVANLITTAGADRVLTIDLHAEQIQGFFDIPTDNLFAGPVFAKDINKKFDSDNLVAVSPDVGGVVRTRGIANKLGASIAIIDKRRSKPGESEVMNIVGDVAGKDCIILDDIIDSAGTICNAANKLIEDGAKSVAAYITHGVLTGKALERVEKSSLSELVITNSINIGSKTSETSKLKVVSIAPLLGEAIKRISEESSVSSLFEF
ncbi:ribose-phosphate pyrophosphokinase [Pelagibacterales bacterium]|jgi:ribose-phosphate pyrophosphokinase|nr:ribose-phosphate pyrophosphokinase [Pelagibacterales bacterium]MBL6861501.1 ribose-phosphate pyrophosphokinase [Pelagibacterales bacterium]MDA7764038.1 ribose-phosphate pyrophosphokinase [Pelagibacterales bacterium]MDB9818305.1 ribose-phosphate pyrophosphokinase [Pelagibacterales bacterium]MDB9955519.1 ribose-phosphate pyrophosphokinase [Pelagibacterales bacterium]|tara:strand:- start:3693 stop:4628 length:936 start_codon:yes stop_codon:yes gene_type:complete